MKKVLKKLISVLWIWGVILTIFQALFIRTAYPIQRRILFSGILFISFLLPIIMEKRKKKETPQIQKFIKNKNRKEIHWLVVPIVLIIIALAHDLHLGRKIDGSKILILALLFIPPAFYVSRTHKLYLPEESKKLMPPADPKKNPIILPWWSWIFVAVPGIFVTFLILIVIIAAVKS